MTGLWAGEVVEEQGWGKLGTFRGKVYVGRELEVLEVAISWRDRDHTVWVDGSGIEGS